MYGLEKLERAEADIPRTMTDQEAEEKERERVMWGAWEKEGSKKGGKKGEERERKIKKER